MIVSIYLLDYYLIIQSEQNLSYNFLLLSINEQIKSIILIKSGLSSGILKRNKDKLTKLLFVFGKLFHSIFAQ